VNLLVAASHSDHPHHQSAITWLEAALTNCSRGERLRQLPMVAAGFLRLLTHPQVFVEPTPLAAPQDVLAPLIEPLCRQHQLVGNALSDGWIAAAVLARRDSLVTFDRDFVPLLPSRQARTPRMGDGPDTGPCRVSLGGAMDTDLVGSDRPQDHGAKGSRGSGAGPAPPPGRHWPRR